jgi:Zn-dependent protease/predicted transcriptional regulator
MRGLRVGKIFGIDLHIDWSWLFIFALVSWSLASMFGQIHREWPALTQWALAATAALLFFISVLAHELAHSIVARARKIPVRSITLFLFGGVSNIQKEPTSPFTEFIIAIVGPLTSFLLGGFFLILGSRNAILNHTPITTPYRILSELGPFSTIFVWLGSVNIILGFFNLIPGFPLDGGRVLRSILWGLTNNLVKATRWASWVGQAVAWILIMAGVSMLLGRQIPFLGTGFLNGMWMIFIGWFLQNAAAQSYRKILVHDILEDVPVKKMMHTDVPVVPANMTAETLINNHLMGSSDQAFIVSDDEKTVGMVTIDDIHKLPPESRQTTRVREIMTPSKQLIGMAPEENASDALDRFQNQNVHQLPVVIGNKIVGMLDRQDIVRWLELQSHAG